LFCANSCSSLSALASERSSFSCCSTHLGGDDDENDDNDDGGNTEEEEEEEEEEEDGSCDEATEDSEDVSWVVTELSARSLEVVVLGVDCALDCG
jgi:hypothetical protein